MGLTRGHSMPADSSGEFVPIKRKGGTVNLPKISESKLTAESKSQMNRSKSKADPDSIGRHNQSRDGEFHSLRNVPSSSRKLKGIPAETNVQEFLKKSLLNSSLSHSPQPKNRVARESSPGTFHQPFPSSSSSSNPKRSVRMSAPGNFQGMSPMSPRSISRSGSPGALRQSTELLKGEHSGTHLPFIGDSQKPETPSKLSQSSVFTSTSKWKLAASASNGQSSMKVEDVAQASLAKAKLTTSKSTAYERRKEYTDTAHADIAGRTTLSLEGGRIPISEISDLKALFNAMDVDGNAVVTRKEMSKFDPTKFGTGIDKQSIMMVLKSLNEDVTFEMLLKRTYPKLTSRDIKTCIQQFDKAAVTRGLKKKLTVKEELKEVKEIWDLHRQPGRYEDEAEFISGEGFREILATLREEASEEQARELYREIMNPKTRYIRQNELSLWWINHFREEKVEWELVKDEVEKFWKQFE